ncbi:tetratricopeptide repeat protein [Neobacillus sp. SAB-20_R2A]|uniref:tetratricopeptide repeat protein n=1 Tax=Neobacillus sp. SAB-20_R2A TaxID=3120519 RepID=UPI003C6E144B
MQLYRELKAIDSNYPFVYEIYDGDRKEGLPEFIREVKNKEEIYISFDAHAEHSLIHVIVRELYSFYQEEAPNLIDNLKKIGFGTTKISLFLSGKLLTGGFIYLMAPWIGSLITVTQWTNKDEEKEEKHKLALKALKKFKEEEEHINQLDTLILAMTRLLFTLNYTKKIFVHIKHPENLNTIDLQFLITYYSLFKDQFSRTQIAQETGLFSVYDNIEATSPLVTILEWGNLKPRDSLADSYFEDDMINPQLKLWRWFLRRYKMVDDLYIKYIPDMPNSEDVFVGRHELISSLKDTFAIAKDISKPMIRTLAGNSGMGKSTIAKQFRDELLRVDAAKIHFVNTNYSSELIGVSKGLTEIRNAINKLNVKINPTFTRRIKNVLVGNEKVKEKVSSLSRLFNVSSDMESLLSPILSVKGASLGAIGEVISGVSAIKDSLELKNSFQDTTYNIASLNISNQENGNSIQEIIKGLTQDALKLLEKIKENNETLVWIVDDFQWMDEESAMFFTLLLDELDNMRIPVMFLFLERQSDSISRINSFVRLEHFKKLHKMLEHTLMKIEGFQAKDIEKYLTEIMKNDQQKNLTETVATALAEWFQIDKGKQLEPLFLKETVNLFQDSLNQQSSLFVYDSEYKRWNWAKNHPQELAALVRKNLNEWYASSEQTDRMAEKFTPMIQAVLEERISRLSKHFHSNLGIKLIHFLEAGAFIGEPMSIKSALKYVTGNEQAEVSQNVLDEIEFTYMILVRFYSKTSLSSLYYLFAHSVYKEFLEMRYLLKRKDSEINNEHVQMFKLIDEELSEMLEEDLEEEIIVPLLKSAFKHGSYATDETMIERTLKFSHQIIQYDLGNLKFDNALNQCDSTIQLSMKHFGDKDFHTIEALNQKAAIYYEAGDYKEAIKLLKEIYPVTNGSEWQELDIAVKNNLGINYRHLGDYPKAIKYYNQVLEFNGLDQTSKMTIMNNLAVAYKNSEKYTDAERMYKDLLKICDTKDNTEYQEMKVDVLHNLGRLYESIREYDKAASVTEEAFMKNKEKYGLENYKTVKVMNSLGSIYKELKHPEAEKLLYDSMSLFEKLLPPLHKDIALAYQSYASYLYSKNPNDLRAEQYIRKALKIFIYGVGEEENIYFAQMLDSFGLISLETKKYRKAEKLLLKSISIKKKILEPLSPDLGQSIAALGHCYLDSKQEDKGLPLLCRALEIMKLDNFEYYVVGITHTIMNYYLQSNDIKGVISFLEKEVEGWYPKILPSKKYIEFVDILIKFYEKDKEYEKAKKYLPYLIENTKRHFGPNSKALAISYNYSGMLETYLGKPQNLKLAENYLNNAIKIMKSYHKMDKKNLHTCTQNMMKLLLVLNNPQKTNKFIKENNLDMMDFISANPRSFH